MKLKATVMSLALALGFAGTSAFAADDGRVVMTSPAKDGAYVLKMKGLVNNHRIKLLNGDRKAINDGIVIRKSFVKDGKVTIPAGGLYTTSRCSNWWSFNDHTFTIAGKLFHFITDEYQQDVVKNVTMKKGEMVFGNEEKTRGWELSSLDVSPMGIEGAHMAYFKVVKTTGNYYGNPFIVVAGKNITPSTNSRSVIYVDEITPTEAKIKELVTVSTSKALISPNEPVMGMYGKGESFKVGNATVEVVDIKGTDVTVKMTDGKGTITKTLKADKATMDLFPSSRVSCANLYALSAGGSETVNINVHNEGGMFADGKVALMGYSDVITVTNGGKWVGDERFLTRPEICAECSFIHEVVIENDKPIVLDAKNNVFEGPDGYFKIVIDKISGDTVEAWHVETKEDKTGNLAGRAKGKHIDLVVGAECRSTGHFFSRVYADLYKETQE